MAAKAWKAVVVLSGSIVEAILIDALSDPGIQTPKHPGELQLANLIEIAIANHIISDQTKELSTVIRKYRNLIHPGRVTRLETSVDINHANIAFRVVEIVLAEVTERKKNTYGLTAEQLFDKLGSGETVLSLVAHLVKETREEELFRLLTEVLPGAYFSSIADGDAPIEAAEHLAICHRAVHDSASENVQELTAQSYYETCCKAPEWRS